VAAAATWRADLVEKRRRIRTFVVLSGSAYTVVMFAVRLSSPHGRLSEASATFDVAVLLGTVAVTAIGLLRLAPSELFDRRASTPDRAGVGAPVVNVQPAAASEPESDAPTVADPADDRLADALQRAMREERVYREEGL